jgi:hypothetical protein
MAVLFISKVYKPWTDARDSSNRVGALDDSDHGFRSFVLNPYFITDLKTHTNGSTFSYSDNLGDRREKWSTIISDHTVAQVQAHLESSPNSNSITLPIHKNNNPEKETTDVTIQWATIAYADRYNPDPENHAWVVYDKGSFKRVEVLVNLAIEDIVDLVRSGSTTTTFSTVPDYFD